MSSNKSVSRLPKLASPARFLAQETVARVPLAVVQFVALWIRGQWPGVVAALAAGACGLALRIAPAFEITDTRALSSARLEPGVFGIFRPFLLLPEGLSDHLTPAQFEAIVAHELCHVRRRDNFSSAIHMVVEALFWFHPAVWWIRARLVEERERACDEAVLRMGSDPPGLRRGNCHRLQILPEVAIGLRIRG